MTKNKKPPYINAESVHAYGANKKRVTRVESDELKDEGFVREQL